MTDDFDFLVQNVIDTLEFAFELKFPVDYLEVNELTGKALQCHPDSVFLGPASGLYTWRGFPFVIIRKGTDPTLGNVRVKSKEVAI